MSVGRHFFLWGIGLAKAETQTTICERACLVKHASGRLRLAEIGVWHGVTTIQLRGAMAADAVLLAIDPFPAGRLGFSMQRVIARREVGRGRNGSVRWVRTTGAQAGADYARAGEPLLDFMFIDGDHTYDGLKQDWEAWSGLIAIGGVVGLHDSFSSKERNLQGAGSARFTGDVIRSDSRFEWVETVDTLTVMRRR